MKITLVENFRALFYAPFYAALELGAYRDQDLEVAIITPPKSGQSTDIIASGAAQVSWGGPMRLMLALEKNPASETVAFCEVAGRDPFYLIGREPCPGFSVRDLLGKRVATVIEVPTPWICLQRDLELAGIDPASLTRTPDRTMQENLAALRAGEVDVVQVFHPYAHDLIASGVGHVWYAAADRGPCCYTTLNTTRSFIAEHPEVILGMTRGMYKTQRWIAEHSGAELATVVAAWLGHIPADVLAACFEQYKASGVWSREPRVQRAGLEWKRDAMLAWGGLSRKYDYEAYVDPTFAEQAVE